MRFTISKKELAKALKTVGMAIPRKSPREILECVKLTAGEGWLRVTGTDLELTVEQAVTADVEVETPGELLVNAALLSSVLSQCTADSLTIELADAEKHTVKVTYDGAEYELNGDDPEEYPGKASGQWEAFCDVDAGVLSGLLSRVSFAAAKDSIRFAINSVLLQRAGGVLCAVATDGHRLAVDKSGLVMHADDPGAKLMLPAKAVACIERMLGDAASDDKVSVQTAEKDNVFRVRCGSTVITSRVIEGSFPAWEDIVPKDNDKAAVIGVGDFLTAVRQAAVMASEESFCVKMTFGESGVALVAGYGGRGKAAVRRDLVSYNGDECFVGLKPGYVQDVLGVLCKGDDVEIRLKDKDRPVLIVSGDYRYVLMPVSVED